VSFFFRFANGKCVISQVMYAVLTYMTNWIQKYNAGFHIPSFAFSLISILLHTFVISLNMNHLIRLINHIIHNNVIV